MPVTDVDICNLGLGLIGASDIATLSAPAKPNEIRCARFYPQCRDSELRKHRWNFAKRWQQMTAADPSKVHPRLKYAYPLPTAPWCLRIIRRAHDNGPIDWVVEGRYVYTDMAPGWWLPFIARASEAEFDPLFVDVLAARIAVSLCEPNTQSNTKKDDAQMAYRMAMIAAKSADSFEKEPEQDLPDSWELARY